ncbi:uncharacterized protein EV420DRAFT_1584599 [Desarmillaria tabescens]|uniref:Ribosomal RNA methyltransferase FtsJ domain-containing protein n=1 Tax=Armillaria tabescens TaxID=1929756 RepID=A0AA39MM71_ARMTA|nr:uncharacterized protein EV420DRAFT_1584599 [Desarmillaria tabescens]KAK0439053.1 hypothetical protein EV420DRAFT_1584599 [Desarmillaria tabescens]
MSTITSTPNHPMSTCSARLQKDLPTEQQGNEAGEEYMHPITVAIEQSGFTELRYLNSLRTLGQESAVMERHYERQQHTADGADKTMTRSWFLRMRQIMQEIDRFCPTHLEFCCPGGFSSYILDKNTQASGFGISLSPQEGGHPFLMDESLLNRYSIVFANIARFELGPSSDPELLPTPARTFDLVVMDASHLRNQPQRAAHKVYISELILGLRAVKMGGSIVLKLHRPESDYSARLLYLLDKVSWRIKTFKPMSIHKDRGSFYVIVRGVGLDVHHRPSFERQALLSRAVESFQMLWVDLGEEGRERNLVPEDLNFIITVDDLVKEYTDRLGWLGRKVWEIQARALVALFRREGVAVN